jgi:outer membrane protein assembly factor BamA
MKRTKVTLPMVVQWGCTSVYVATKGTRPQAVTFVAVATGQKFENDQSENSLLDLINRGVVKVLAEPQTVGAPITVEVDSSAAVAKLEAATQAATKLSAALADVKALLA